MSDGPVGVPVVALPAVVAVPAGREVPALQADASAHAARQLVQVHVEAALPRVLVAIAHWKQKHRGPARANFVGLYVPRYCISRCVRTP